jgi:hypothetical protein
MHWPGEISGNGIQWERRTPSGKTRVVDNRLLPANRKAKRLRRLAMAVGRSPGQMAWAIAARGGHRRHSGRSGDRSRRLLRRALLRRVWQTARQAAGEPGRYSTELAR